MGFENILGILKILKSAKHSFPCPIFKLEVYDGPDLKLFILVGWDRSSFVCCLVHRGPTDYLLLLQISSGVVWQTRCLHLSRNMLYLLSPLDFASL